MSVKPIVIWGEPVLHEATTPVTDFGPDLQDLVADMFDTMDKANGVGLAATQIGVPLRVFVYEMENDDDVPARGVVVNPRLTLSKISGNRPDPDEESEGCLSVPGENFPLKRADWVKVNAQDEHGNPLEFEATGWFARCMQHETDHLDGYLYADRLNERYGRKARRTAKRLGWLVPGNSWMPGVDPDPFGHDVGDEDE